MYLNTVASKNLVKRKLNFQNVSQ